jgi:hypothetical protein
VLMCEILVEIGFSGHPGRHREGSETW